MAFIEGVGLDVELTVLLGLLIILLIYYFMGNRYHVLEQIPGMPNEQAPPVYNTSSCPICLDAPVFGIDTNCGHLHCGDCFIQYHGLYFNGQPLFCPICRQRISLLFLCFSNEERNAEGSAETIQRISTFVRQYNTEMTNLLTLRERLGELPVLLRHFLYSVIQGELFILNAWMQFRLVMYVIFVALYILIPNDLFPEFAYGIAGYIEDVFLVVIVLMYFARVYRNIIAPQE